MPRKTANVPINPIFIGDLPIAEKEALEGFERLSDNTYQNSSLAKWEGVGHDEGTSCDCHYVHGQYPLQGEPLTLRFPKCLFYNVYATDTSE